MRMQRSMVLVIFGAVTGLAVHGVASSQFSYGPVIFHVGNHGLHGGDVPILGLWAIAMVAGAALWRRPAD